MTITRDGNGSWPGISCENVSMLLHQSIIYFTFFDHNLMTDTPTGGVVCDSMLLGKFVDKRVLLQIRFRFVLNVVVQRKHFLRVSIRRILIQH